MSTNAIISSFNTTSLETANTPLSMNSLWVVENIQKRAKHALSEGDKARIQELNAGIDTVPAHIIQGSFDDIVHEIERGNKMNRLVRDKDGNISAYLVTEERSSEEIYIKYLRSDSSTIRSIAHEITKFIKKAKKEHYKKISFDGFNDRLNDLLVTKYGFQNTGWIHYELELKSRSPDEQLQQALSYLETDTNARSVWNTLTKKEQEHIEGLITRYIHKGQDPRIYTLYGALDTLKKARIELKSIHTLGGLYAKSSQINTENDKTKSIAQYTQDLCWVLGEEYESLATISQKALQEELRETIHTHLNKWLHQAVVACLDTYKIPLPKDPKWEPIHITRTYLGGLNMTAPTRVIGKLDSVQYPYNIVSLQNKEEMRKESAVLGHCVGDSDYYIEKVLRWEILVLSLRDDAGKPYWTIEYNIKEQSIDQFKGGWDVTVNSLPESQELVFTTLDALSAAWYIVKRIDERFDYLILRNISDNRYESSAEDSEVLKEKCLSWVYYPLNGSLTLDQEDREEDILKLCQLPGIKLNLAKISEISKNKITKVAWTLIDRSWSISYLSLRSVGKDVDFEGITSAKGLKNLTSIGGDGVFWSLKSAEGLENLMSIGGNAIFRSLKSAEGLGNLESIEWIAEFNNLTSAEGLKNLISIGEDARFESITSAEGLEKLVNIGGDAIFRSLTSAQWLEKLGSIRGDAHFESLETSAEGLESLTSIGKNAMFRILQSAKGLEKLGSIGENADFRKLESAEGLENLTHIGRDADFWKITSAKGLEKLESIGGDANFDNLPESEKQKIPALRGRS